MVKVTDAANNTATASLSVTIAPAVVPLAITTTSLPSGTVGLAYSGAVAATGGTTPYTWSATGLPAGLGINASTGAITGTPTAAGTSTAMVKVTDAANNTATASLSVTIAPAVTPLGVTTTSLPNGVVGKPYSATLSATGGTPPYTWSDPPLPAGLTLNASTGAITGTPTTAGTFIVTITVTDSVGGTASASLFLTVSSSPATPLDVTTERLPHCHIGDPYSATLAATGGIPPYSWSALDPSDLPPGITLSSTGTLSGTDSTQKGKFRITVTVTDSTGATANEMLSLSCRGHLPTHGHQHHGDNEDGDSQGQQVSRDD
jgi:hypothetical protein